MAAFPLDDGAVSGDSLHRARLKWKMVRRPFCRSRIHSVVAKANWRISLDNLARPQPAWFNGSHNKSFSATAIIADAYCFTKALRPGLD